jgi:formate dehydrogenase assembly factor FdhD
LQPSELHCIAPGSIDSVPSRFATVQAKFILSIVPVVVLVAVLFSAIFGYHDYKQAHQALKSKQESLPQVYSVALAALSQNFQQALDISRHRVLDARSGRCLRRGIRRRGQAARAHRRG